MCVRVLLFAMHQNVDVLEFLSQLVKFSLCLLVEAGELEAGETKKRKSEGKKKE